MFFYSLINFNPIDINECREGIEGRGEPACDALHGTCTDTFGSFLCDCQKGFVKGTDMKKCIAEINFAMITRKTKQTTYSIFFQ
uniref:EGF-like domain-containing protein n=1 Tax=Ascaris lumbricoides TaxID=6252 RepID=A0A0M3HIL7_ASCLU